MARNFNYRSSDIMPKSISIPIESIEIYRDSNRTTTANFRQHSMDRLEHKIKELEKENIRLRTDIKNKDSEIHRLKKELKGVVTITDIKEEKNIKLNEKVDFLMNNIEGRDDVMNEIIQKNRILSKECEQLKGQMNKIKVKFKGDIHRLKQENEELKYQLGKRRESYDRSSMDRVSTTLERNEDLNNKLKKISDEHNDLVIEYNNLRKQLNDKDVSLELSEQYKKKCVDINRELTECKGKVESYHTMLMNTDNQVTHLREDNERLKGELQYKDSEIYQLQSNLRESDHQTKKLNASIDRRDISLKELSVEKIDLTDKVKNYEKDINCLQRELQETRVKDANDECGLVDNTYVRRLLDEIQTLKNTIDDKDVSLELSEQYKKKCDDINRELTECKDKVESYHTRLMNTDNQVTHLQEDNERLKGELQYLKKTARDNLSRQHIHPETLTQNVEMKDAVVLEDYKARINILETINAQLQSDNDTLTKMADIPARDCTGARELSEDNDHLKKTIDGLKESNLKTINDYEKKFGDMEREHKNSVTQLSYEKNQLTEKIHAHEESSTKKIEYIEQQLAELQRKEETDNRTIINDQRDDHIEKNKLLEKSINEINDVMRKLKEEARKDKIRIDDLEKECQKTMNEKGVLREEIERLKKTIKDIKDEHLNLKECSEMPLSVHSRPLFSSIPNSSNSITLNSDTKVIELQKETDRLNNLLNVKDEELSKKQCAINIMKEKIKAQSNESDVNAVNQLRQQNTSYSKQLNDSVDEIEKLKASNKQLTDQAALLRKDKNNLQAEMDNMKKLNFLKGNVVADQSRDISPPRGVAPPRVVTDQSRAISPIRAVAPTNIAPDLLQKVPDWWHRHMK